MATGTQFWCIGLEKPSERRWVGIVAGKALPLFHGCMYDLLSFGGIPVASIAKSGNGLWYLTCSFRKMEIVAHRTVLLLHRLMDKAVFKKGLVAVLAVGHRSKQQYRQSDEKYQDVESRTGHPDMLITDERWCQQVEQKCTCAPVH
jgi:hypothetical protein